jgi:hypothetical protein
MKEKIKKFGNLLLIGIIAFILGFSDLKAASAYISVKSSASNVIVGRTFNVTVTISSSVALGSWEYTIDYNTSLFKLTSGQSYIADYGNGTKKSASYSYTFKAIASGTGRIGVRSYGAYDWSEARMSVSSGSATVKTMTQAELEASYSKNNNLSALSVEGYTLSTAFNKDTLEYIVELPSNVESINIIATKEDSRASVTGAGTVAVSEGENRKAIVVTAENGSSKTYTIVAKVSDPNPIKVITSDKKEMTVVKRESLLTIPETFTKTTIKINDIEVPAFYSEITKYTLVGLKNDGNVGLYVYNKNNNSYIKYNVITFNQIKLFALDMTEDGRFKNYILTKTKINDTEVSAYKIKDASEYSVIYAVNIETGKNDYYIHDSKTNTVIRYTSEEVDILNKKINKYFKLIIALGVESVILITAIIIFISKNNKNNKKKIKEKHIKDYENDESSLDNLDKEISNLDNTRKLKKLKKSSKN